MARCIITLVHGTWSRQAAWTLPRSKFRRGLQKRLGKGIIFETVGWSGRNRASARLAAADALRTRLNFNSDHHPDAQQFVIGHSHAGNVAMHLWRNLDLRDRVTGVVTLATPFLHVEPLYIARDQAEVAATSLLRYSVAVGCLVIFVFCALLFSVVERILPFSIPLGVEDRIVMVITVVLMIVATVAVVKVPTFARRFVAWAERLRQQITLPSTVPCPVLILRTSGDEASLGLGASALLTYVAKRAAGLLAFVLRTTEGIFRAARRPPDGEKPTDSPRFANVAGYLLLATYLALTASGVALLRTETGTLNVFYVLSAALLALLLLDPTLFVIRVICVGVLRALLATILLLRAIVLSPFGTDIGAASLVLDVTAEATPPGTWRLVHVSSPVSSPTMGLSHSRIYDEGTTLDAIADFIRPYLAISAQGCAEETAPRTQGDVET